MFLAERLSSEAPDLSGDYEWRRHSINQQYIICYQEGQSLYKGLFLKKDQPLHKGLLPLYKGLFLEKDQPLYKGLFLEKDQPLCSSKRTNLSTEDCSLKRTNLSVPQKGPTSLFLKKDQPLYKGLFPIKRNKPPYIGQPLYKWWSTLLANLKPASHTHQLPTPAGY
jgi:hypothetical protein